MAKVIVVRKINGQTIHISASAAKISPEGYMLFEDEQGNARGKVLESDVSEWYVEEEEER